MSLWCYGSNFVVLIDYCIILIDYVLGLKLFLSLCSIVIDYDFVLIDYMLWFMASFGFMLCFNQSFYILINYKGIKGRVLLAYLIDYNCVLIDYLYQLFVLDENKGQFNELLCYSNRLLACFFVCNPLHIFFFTSSTTIITAITPVTHLNLSL